MGTAYPRIRPINILLFSLLLLTPRTSIEAQVSDEVVVTGLSHDFIQAISSKDTDTLDLLLAPQAMVYSVRPGEAGPEYRARTRDEFLQDLFDESRELRERIWDPVVEVNNGLAMVWAPYDFHLDGEFSHCGIDVLTFLELADGWRVVNLTYNVVREGCGADFGRPLTTGTFE